MAEKNNLLMLLVVAVMGVLALSIIYFFSQEFRIDYSPTKTQPSLVPPAATGNIDDLTDALTKELYDEDLLLIQEDGDAELIISDSQEINDFAQSIDENEL